MKPRLLILSDLFGGKDSQWVKIYMNLLQSKFEIQYYDVVELANIDSDNFIESEIHNQFLNGGIDKAVQNLLQLETGKLIVLGFSIGGTIAWKAGLLGLKINSLTAISSSRIRYESQNPDCRITLIYGELDMFKPDYEWIIKSGLQVEIIKNEGHDFYRKFESVEIILKRNF